MLMHLSSRYVAHATLDARASKLVVRWLLLRIVAVPNFQSVAVARSRGTVAHRQNGKPTFQASLSQVSAGLHYFRECRLG